VSPLPDSRLPSLSVVIPAYDEAARILPYLERIISYLAGRGEPYEILVVDDGSRDDTAALVEKLQAEEPAVRLIRLERNGGKGRAVRAGMREAKGTLRLFADADGAAPIEEVSRLEAAITAGAQVAIGSRFLASRDPRYRVQARWHRSFLGNLFNGVIQRLGLAGITDTQCGFKLFPAAVAEDLFAVSQIDGYGFDLELLYVARLRGYRIAEVPINWTDQPGSKVRVWRDGLRMFREMLAVRLHARQSRYAAPAG
jgi:dolichyl-phosphate beta-glucosyltransferase